MAVIRELVKGYPLTVERIEIPDSAEVVALSQSPACVEGEGRAVGSGVPLRGGYFRAPALTTVVEAVEKAYDSAFPTNIE